jgi:hypothetical protein
VCVTLPLRKLSYLVSAHNIRLPFPDRTRSHVVLPTSSVTLVALPVAYTLHAWSIMPFSQCFKLSTSAFLLGFVARRLPSLLFDHPEDATIAQKLTLQFLLTLIFMSDVEWIRLYTIAGDLSVKYPDFVNVTFQVPYRNWFMTQGPKLG